jgi:transposase
MVDSVLKELSPSFDLLYSHTGRPSIAPEKLLRALLLQVLYTGRSERLLMEQLDYNLLFRWFVGLNMDDPMWDPTVFSKNRERLLAGELAQAFFEQVLAQAREHDLLSDEHFTVDGRCSKRGPGRRVLRPSKLTRPKRLQATLATRASTSGASGAPTPRMPRPPTPRRVCTRRLRGRRPNCATWGTC